MILDDEETIQGVYDALDKSLLAKNQRGEFCLNDVSYKTDTIKINDREVIIAAKKKGITDNFLAKLRNNDFSSDAIILFLLLPNAIDTLISGTQDLAASGMPFNQTVLTSKIIEVIEEYQKNGNLTKGESIFLKYEVNQKSFDRFADNSSLYVYMPFLTIISKGNIQDKDYYNLGVFPDSDIKQIKSEDAIKKRTIDNAQKFEMIDHDVEINDFDELKKIYKDSFVNKLKSARAQDQHWYEGIKYGDLDKEKLPKRKKKKFSITRFNVYYVDNLGNKININRDNIFESGNDEEDASKSKREILIFNDAKAPQVVFSVETNLNLDIANMKYKSNSIEHAEKSPRAVQIFINTPGCAFARYDLKSKDQNPIRLNLCVLNFNSDLFGELTSKYDLNLTTAKDTSKFRITLIDTDDLVIFNDGKEANPSSPIHITEANQNSVNIRFNDQESMAVQVDDELYDDNGQYNFDVHVDSVCIPFTVDNREKKREELNGIRCFKLRFSPKRNKIKYYASNQTVVRGTTAYTIKDTFRRDLYYEYQMLKNHWIAAEIDETGNLVEVKLDHLPNALKDIYDAFSDSIIGNRQLPSLIDYNDYFDQARDYIKAFEECINKAEEKKALSAEINDALKIASISDARTEKVRFMPLHPLNVAYELKLSGETGISNVRDELVKNINPHYLLPYIYFKQDERDLYAVAEDDDTPGWTTYAKVKEKKNNATEDNISKLVCKKIEEYKSHFGFLFDDGNDQTIDINLIDMGNCEEVLKGLCRYYLHALSDNMTVVSDRFNLYIYGTKQIENIFSCLESRNVLRKYLESTSILGNKKNLLEELTNILINNVKCYFSQNTSDFHYAHLTFYQMPYNDEVGNTTMTDIPTGTSLNGIISDTPTVLVQENYETGFGTKFAASGDSLIKLAAKYNALFNVAFSVKSFESDQSIITTIHSGLDNKLNQIYQASNWVVFINPKVGLSYFVKNHSDNRDNNLIIIHYSDGSESPTSYESITVTNKSEQYGKIIEEQLKNDNIKSESGDINKLLNIFNAINGSWLLELVTAKKTSAEADSKFKREKMSILSAIKLSLAIYQKENIVWIPISLEEILRVSKGTGLSQKEGVLSAKNLGFDSGATSDDILLVGIEECENKNLKVYLHPVEVKIGNNEQDVIDKAKKQLVNTHSGFLNRSFNLDSSHTSDMEFKLNRNFFIQFVILSASKLKLYNVFPEGKWDLVLNDYRSKLLNDDYTISRDLDSQIGVGTIISFKHGHSGIENTIEQCDNTEKVELIELDEAKGSEYLIRDVNEIRSEIARADDSLLHEVFEVNCPIIKESGEEDEEEIDAFDDEESDDEGDEETFEETEPVTKSGETDQTNTKNVSESSKADHASTELSKQVKIQSSETKKIYIGRNRIGEKVYWEFWHPQLANRHLLITGTSGQGKTYAIQSLLYELSKTNVSAVIFDYTEGFTPDQLEDEFKEKIGGHIQQRLVYTQGVPVNPFKQNTIKMAGQEILEKSADVANRIANIFSHVYSFGPQQSSIIYQVTKSCLDEYGGQATLEHFKAKLAEMQDENSYAKSVFSKTLPFFDSISFMNDQSFDWNDILYSDSSTIYVFQLTSLSRNIQVIVTELMLWDLWYFTTKYGSKDKPFVVVLDEAQNLSIKENSPSKSILTEGRKFGWSAWYATQSLKVMSDDEITRLNQAATKLHFKPTEDEIIKLAKQIDPSNSDYYVDTLKALTKGQCVMMGSKENPDGNLTSMNPSVVSIASFKNRN